MNIFNLLLIDNKKLHHKPWFIKISDKINVRSCMGPIVLGTSISFLMILFWWSNGIFDFLHKDVFTPKDLHYFGSSLFLSILSGYAIGFCAYLSCRSVGYLDTLRVYLPPRFSAVDSDFEALKSEIIQVHRDAWVLCTLAGIGMGLLLCYGYNGPSEPLFKDILAHCCPVNC